MVIHNASRLPIASRMIGMASWTGLYHFFVAGAGAATGASAFVPPSPGAGGPHQLPCLNACADLPRPNRSGGLLGLAGTALGSVVSLRGGAGGGGGAFGVQDVTPLAFDWCANLGAPAALVAGAVLATVSQNREAATPRPSDAGWVRAAKKASSLLLFSSFALEVLSIFVSTMVGTLILSNRHVGAGAGAGAAGASYASAMDFMRSGFADEQLAAFASFLQGLFNWLAAVALQKAVPVEGEGASSRSMNLFISSYLLLLILIMVSFFNVKVTMYANYAHFLWSFVSLVFRRMFVNWPPRPMLLLTLPTLVSTVVLAWRVTTSPPDEPPPSKDVKKG